MIDLVAWVADSHQEQVLRSLVRRTQALRIREPVLHVYRDPNKDAGCRTSGAQSLRSFTRQYQHAILMLDHQGSGAEATPALELERKLEDQLRQCGWDDRAVAIVIEPELENWVWSGSPRVDEVLGWARHIPTLRTWLETEGLLAARAFKPQDPKRALQRALQYFDAKVTSVVFAKLAAEVSFQDCQDRSFGKLRDHLQRWFPA